ncbi:MAG: TetR/AcrR family transcriptional regulator [Spirochaetes bacterium]|nr:TetR/AcrR family transcriptional regulator [Spirochaetota bacterium]
MGIKERKIREKEERRIAILDAARTLLFQEGISSTSVHQIAKLTELSVGTIYLYFSSKEEIFATLQEEGLDILYSKVEEAGGGNGRAGERLSSMAQAYLDFSREHKKYFDIFNYFISSPDVIFPPNLKNRIDKHGNRILVMVEGAIKQGIADGDFNEVNVKNSALYFWGSLHGLIQFRKLKNTMYRHENFEELYRYAADHFIRGLSGQTGEQGRSAARKSVARATS